MENLSKILPDIAAMDEEIKIQSYTPTRNAAGEQVLTFTDYATLLARVEWPETGLKEIYSADQKTAFRRIVFWIRYDPNVNEKMRILYREVETCEIQGIRTEGRNRFTVITCQMREKQQPYLTDENGFALTDEFLNVLTP